jgi:hypothetical protein
MLVDTCDRKYRLNLLASRREQSLRACEAPLEQLRVTLAKESLAEGGRHARSVTLFHTEVATVGLGARERKILDASHTAK